MRFSSIAAAILFTAAVGTYFSVAPELALSSPGIGGYSYGVSGGAAYAAESPPVKYHLSRAELEKDHAECRSAAKEQHIKPDQLSTFMLACDRKAGDKWGYIVFDERMVPVSPK